MIWSAIKKRFIENGLKKGEKVICFTPYNVNKLEEEIASSGIDVNYYKQQDMLYFYHIEDIAKRLDGTKVGFNDMLDMLTGLDSSNPFRVLGTAIPDVSTKDRVTAQIEGERVIHLRFENKPFSFLCPFDISDIEPEERPRWLRELSANHHNLIYATSPDKAVAFETDLLNPVDD
ncbi:MAG: MEDS domain-containing protein [Nitrosopumilus sp.]